MTNKRAVVVITNGSEEIEAVSAIDTLRRAGIEVTVAGLNGKETVICSRNAAIVPDTSLEEAIKTGPFDVVVLPGGLKGAQAFSQSEMIGKLLKEQEKSGLCVAAVCAASTAIKAHGVFHGNSITSHPSVKEQITDGNHYDYKDERVVVDGNLITSRGPGTSIEWAIAIAEKLIGTETAQMLRSSMLVKE